MRQIGTVPKRLDVNVLADYLLTLGMKTRVDEAADGWIVWIYHEDHFCAPARNWRPTSTAPMTPAIKRLSTPRRRSAVNSENSTSSSARIIAKLLKNGGLRAYVGAP